jgi:hypothetical protein
MRRRKKVETFIMLARVLWLQDDETKDFIARRGRELGKTYIDYGLSGTTNRCPQLARLLADPQRRKFDVARTGCSGLSRTRS